MIIKRSIAFKHTANVETDDFSVTPLTLAFLLNGYDVPCVSIIPHSIGEGISNFYNPDIVPTDPQIFYRCDCLRKSWNQLYKVYSEEFLAHLGYQSVDRPNRYDYKKHIKLKVGDVVSVRTKMAKPYDYPCCVVTATEGE